MLLACAAFGQVQLVLDLHGQHLPILDSLPAVLVGALTVLHAASSLHQHVPSRLCVSSCQEDEVARLPTRLAAAVVAAPAGARSRVTFDITSSASVSSITACRARKACAHAADAACLSCHASPLWQPKPVDTDGAHALSRSHAQAVPRHHVPC